MHFDAPASNPNSDGFELWEMDAAWAVVNSFLAARGPLSNLTVEDLLQEALLTWWSERHKYSASRGATPQTFLNRVVTNRLRDLRREELDVKRSGDRNALTLDLADDEQPFAHRVFIEDGVASNNPEQAAEAAELAARLARARHRLSARQRVIAAGLAEDKTRTELSRELNVSRMTIYSDLDGIKRVFREEGLEEFLE